MIIIPFTSYWPLAVTREQHDAMMRLLAALEKIEARASPTQASLPWMDFAFTIARSRGTELL